MDVLVFCIYGIILFFISFIIYMKLANKNVHPSILRSENEKYFFDPELNDYAPFPNISDNCSINLSVIVPAYNEEERLSPMLDETLEFLEKRKEEFPNFKYEIIVVSDGSKDRTVKIGLEYSKKYGSDIIRVLDLKPNRGKGGAVRLGVLSCRGAIILFADADGATKFSDLVKLEEELKKITKSDYLTAAKDQISMVHALICGSRSHLEKESIATRSIFRNLLMHGFHFLVWSLAVQTIRDTQCGFKMFTRKTAEFIFKNIHVERWAFDVEILYLAEKYNIPLAEVAVNWTEMEVKYFI